MFTSQLRIEVNISVEFMEVNVFIRINCLLCNLVCSWKVDVVILYAVCLPYSFTRHKKEDNEFLTKTFIFQ
jgi:hypothetical protein